MLQEGWALCVGSRWENVGDLHAYSMRSGVRSWVWAELKVRETSWISFPRLQLLFLASLVEEPLYKLRGGLSPLKRTESQPVGSMLYVCVENNVWLLGNCSEWQRELDYFFVVEQYAQSIRTCKLHWDAWELYNQPGISLLSNSCIRGLNKLKMVPTASLISFPPVTVSFLCLLHFYHFRKSVIVIMLLSMVPYPKRPQKWCVHP